MIFNAYADTKNGLFDIALKNCGHIFAQNGRRISRPNGRDDWLLFYVAKGSEHFFLDTETDADEGSFLFYKPHERQEHIYLENKTAEFYYIHFYAPPDFDLFGFESSKVYHAKPTSAVCDLFEEIISELQAKLPSYEKICVAKFLNMIGLLERNTVAHERQENRYFNTISFIVQLMNREYEKDYTLEDYAKMCKMSKFHFLRVFKSITGLPPLEYRNLIRIEHAKTLLEDGNMTVREICMRVGYNSLPYFSDAFKKITGLSPSNYRQNYK